ncbi:hypothetical protein [Nonomuraea zeae]|uniref:hypothetical protein n=1 Tax=Nonomuraea zeae TaxID=1642303 RepID=UPI0014784D37|nr:hypothetical protein [Nonomuraea zeae]
MRRLTGAVVSILILLLAVQQAAVADTVRLRQSAPAPGPLPAPRADAGPTTPGTPRRTTTLTPAFRGVAAVPDVAELQADFELRRTGGKTLTFTRTVTSGTAVTVLPADFGLARLQAGAGYAFRARVRDGERVSPWSATAEVTAGGTSAADLKAAARPKAVARRTALGPATTATNATASAAAAAVAMTSPLDGARHRAGPARRRRRGRLGTGGHRRDRYGDLPVRPAPRHPHRHRGGVQGGLLVRRGVLPERRRQRGQPPRGRLRPVRHRVRQPGQHGAPAHRPQP